MPQYLNRQRLALAVVVLALSLAAVAGALAFADERSSGQDVTRPSVPPTPASRTSPAEKVSFQPDKPVQLRIPKISVSSALEDLELGPDRQLNAPRDFGTAGWYVHSPVPGATGPSVIAGHLDSTTGPAIFYRLHELVAGDRIEVANAAGWTAVFTVERTKQVPQDAFPTAEVYGNIDYPGLRLITCQGTFNRQAKRYDHNFVVFARLSDERRS